MVGLGLLMLALGIWGAWLWWRGRLEKASWFHRVCLASAPAGFLALLAGWITAEVGRQPYTVYGILRTADSLSPVTAEAVGTSLIVFVFVYGVVFTAGVTYMLRLVRQGPPAQIEPPARLRFPLVGWMSAEATRRNSG
jgi:cytochrome d ubiquinol oxidase subunit I